MAAGGAGLLGLAVALHFAERPRLYVIGSFRAGGDSIFENRLYVLPAEGHVAGAPHLLLDDLPSARAHAGSVVR